jgi:uncharacterized protein YcbK (DUF882 family)
VTNRPSQHFTYREFKPHDRTRLGARYRPAVKRLCVEVLEPMRAQFGPCYVHSGRRTRERNDQVGGAPLSFHLYELRPATAAADVSFARGTPREWAAFARRVLGNRGGVGTYPTHIHVDLRASRADF